MAENRAPNVAQIDRDLFYKLASDLSEERLQATMALVTELSQLPQESPEWNYVLNRLMKGLSSNRNGARLGFGLCLTEVVFLALQKQVLTDIDHYLRLLLSTLSKDFMKNGKEERGLLFGKLFGLQVLLNEPLFSHVFKSAGPAGGELNLDFTLEYAGALIDVAVSKTWIRESSLYTLYQAVEKLAPLLTSSKSLNAVFELLDSKSLTLTSEGLAIYLFLLHRCHATCKTARLDQLVLRSPWKNNDPLKRGNLPLIANALKEANVSEDSSLKQKGVWAPRLHFVWEVVLSCLFDDGNSGLEPKEPSSKKRRKDGDLKRENIGFPEFWKSVVDDSFFNEKSSSERKYLGLLVFERAFQLSPTQTTSSIFSTNLLRCIINQSSSAERNLHRISQKTLASIVEVCREQPEKTAITFEALAFGENGSVNFDQLTKSKTITTLLSNKSLRPEHLITIVEILARNLLGNVGDLAKTKYSLDTMLHLVRAHKSNADKIWIKPCFSVLTQLGFFQTQELPELNDGEQQKQVVGPVAIERLYSVLADLISVEQETSAVCWPYVALKKILSKQKTQTLLNPIDEELNEIFTDSLAELEKISKRLSKDKSNAQLRALQLLFSINILQAFSGEADSVSVLEDLIAFSKTLYDDGENESYAGFIEILLSLAAQKKALLRKSSMIIWESFVSQVSTEDLSVLLDVLSARENKEGFANLFEGVSEDENETGDEDLEEGEEEEEEDDVQDEESMSEDASDVEEKSDSDRSDYSDNGTERIDKEAASALAKALNLPDSMVDAKGEVHFDDLGDTENEDEDESAEDLDDEKMMELDGQLSEIFKRRKEALSQIPTGSKRKQEVKESRKDVIAFKHKVVDMLEILIRWVEGELKQDSSSQPNVLEKITHVIVPLISCVRTTMDRPLAEKISKLVKNRVTKLKLLSSQSYEGYDQEDTIALLKKVHELMLVKKPGQFQNLYFSVCSSVSIFLAKLLIEISPSMVTYTALLEIYNKTLNEWFKTGKFGVSVFIEFLNWLSIKKQQQIPN
ncbi:LANO_0A07074g1_1 [Lachancea nothofagi CBS 11611]|uniref:LANO_0A07074g1_1 n=1 Tax=Lachancea nothofagi CBS 11611 TaxID=1266666 RepID=A0A1G4IS75_9SACH|nr:LANO_0A07074g1_1 [Lachancea nothofagi CBS 11611]